MFRSFASTLILVGLFGCSKPVAFQGDRTLAIAGAPPASAPAPVPPRVEVRDNKIEIHDKIQFELDKATIMAVSFGLLNEVASVIQKNPHVRKIRIEGHASSEGEAHHNQVLSEARAQAVMTYLVDHGIAKDALLARGYGIDHPIADNATESGREHNRRVEFNIVEQDVTRKRVEIDAKTGREKVIEEDKHTDRAGDDVGTKSTNTTSSK